MPDANEILLWWGRFAAIMSIPDWKNVLYGWQIFVPTAAVAYLIGALPFGLLLARAAGLGDIRRIGSGNIGATNVLRTGRKDIAALTLLLDGAKGFAAVWVADIYFGPDVRFFCAIAVVVGHLFPIWLGFRGGKGVATTLGVLLALAWPIGVAALALWAGVAAVTRYSSLAALISLGTAPVYGWFLGEPQVGALAFVCALLVWSRHVGNLRRLLRGEETRIGAS